MPIVTSTADILAIVGGATTFVAAVFAAIRLSRCQRVVCCWGALHIENKPIPTLPVVQPGVIDAVNPAAAAAPPPPLTRADSVGAVAV